MKIEHIFLALVLQTVGVIRIIYCVNNIRKDMGMKAGTGSII